MLFGKEKTSLKQKGFLQALGVAVYCTLVGLLLGNGDLLFGQANLILGSILMLVLFSVSVLVCGLLVFFQPYRLFSDGKRKEAADLVIFTAIWLAAFLFLSLILTILIR